MDFAPPDFPRPFPAAPTGFNAPARRPRWPWIVGATLGAPATFATWIVVAISCWSDAGGTLTLFGCSSGDEETLDKAREQALMSQRSWIILVVALLTIALPIAGLIRATRNAD